jgi:hypothetical protein
LTTVLNCPRPAYSINICKMVMKTISSQLLPEKMRLENIKISTIHFLKF